MTPMMTTNDERIEACRHVPLHYIVGDTRLNRPVKIQCPFHAESTPSCTLYPNNGRYTGGYKCFGCPKHGNSLDFLVEIGATFNEAVDELSKYI